MIAHLSIDQYTYLSRDFPGHPEVKTSLSNIGGKGLIPGQGAKISYALWPKKTKQNKTKKKHETEAIL